jgi:hypothetical protein
MTRLDHVVRMLAFPSMVASLAVAAPASLAGSLLTKASGALTVRCTEILKNQDVTNGGVGGTGHCALTGAINEQGQGDRLPQRIGNTAGIRRVVVGRKGTITFRVTINLSTGSEPWSVTSGTKNYLGLQGKGGRWWTSTTRRRRSS